MKARRLLAKVLGEARSDYARGLNNLANTHWHMNSYIETEPLYVEARWLRFVETERLRAKVLGEEHRDYANSLKNLAALCSDMGSYEKAKVLYVEATRSQAKVLGEERPDYASSLSNLAIWYSKRKRDSMRRPSISCIPAMIMAY